MKELFWNWSNTIGTHLCVFRSKVWSFICNMNDTFFLPSSVLCNSCLERVGIFVLSPNPQSHLSAPGASACVSSQQSRHIFLLIFVFIWENCCTFATGSPITYGLFCPIKHLHVPSICSSSQVLVPVANFFLILFSHKYSLRLLFHQVSSLLHHLLLLSPSSHHSPVLTANVPGSLSYLTY